MKSNNEFVVYSVKQDISREQDYLRTLLLTIESSVTANEAEDQRALPELKNSYKDRAAVWLYLVPVCYIIGSVCFGFG